ncbi:hypothetical protein Hanom_Chr06g00485271 [Helianthus anomalus]
MASQTTTHALLICLTLITLLVVNKGELCSIHSLNGKQMCQRYNAPNNIVKYCCCPDVAFCFDNKDLCERKCPHLQVCN